jgi:phospholipid/cholesterol/gamma-HCH transport system permease protein
MTAGLSLLEYVGGRILALFGYLGEMVGIIGTCLLQFTTCTAQFKPVTRSVLWRQVQFTGVDAVPFTGLLALLTALCVVVQIQLIGFSQVGQPELFAKIMVAVLVRELGPVIVALVVLARSGTAIATEMANMRVSHELETLRLGGIEPYDYLVVPRLGGVALSLFCLAQAFIIVALAGGFIFSQFLMEDALSARDYFDAITNQLKGIDALIVAGKTVIPGLIIGAIACREGMMCRALLTDVPRATTRAVVRSLIAVFCWDALCTILSYKL